MYVQRRVLHTLYATRVWFFFHEALGSVAQCCVHDKGPGHGVAVFVDLHRAIVVNSEILPLDHMWFWVCDQARPLFSIMVPQACV